MKVVKTNRYSCWISDTEDIRREVVWENTNKLLRRPGFIGVKTGVTITAGPCLATCYQSGEKIFIVVLLRTNKLSRRFKETRWILGLALSKLNKMKYQNEIKAILKNDDELDSDNSEDED
jgi:D-alanyl-D-alanine carboxypeptidase